MASVARGARLGPYETIEMIGSGGMGEVWKARDCRLGRIVAIKISKQQFSERFEREARAISALNHPHICALHDVGQQDGGAYLVMEYIEGRPLAGPLTLEKALDYAAQILDALDAAHQKGIVHRDLKPANILVTGNGVKLLDFGLAKLSRDRKGAETDETATMLTGEHTILGTPHYMAPEQIEGREVDARMDIFAFGCVLYEMLTGKRAFDGKTPSVVTAAVLATEPPPVSKLQPLTPAWVDRIVQTCLEKDPERRWQSALDLRRALGLALADRPASPPSRTLRLWAVAAVALVVGLGLGWIGRHSRESVAEGRSYQLQVNPPPGAEFRLGLLGGSAISPDGRLLAFVASSGHTSRLWIRPLDSLQARELAGTEGAQFPFWSPDSRSLGFFAEGKLKRIEASGGPTTVLAGAPLGRGGTWGKGDVILFSPGGSGGFLQISGSGGTPTTATVVDTARRESSHRWPQFLLDGRRFLYYIRSPDPEVAGVYFASLDRVREPRRLVSSPANAMLARGLGGRPDYLVYLQEGGLVARPFDPNHGQFTGRADVVAEAVGITSAANLAAFSVSHEGTLSYGASGGRFQLMWLNREGKESGPVGAPDYYSALRISPDGRRVMVTRNTPQGVNDLWQYDIARTTQTRLTFNGGVVGTWSPDGRRIAFHAMTPLLFLKEASGAGQEERVTQSPNNQFINDWSPDGRFLLFTEVSGVTQYDLWLLPLEGDRKPIPYLQTPFQEMQGRFSPDGKWIAYTSDESGRPEVYVQSFPASGAKLHASSNGGTFPLWRRDGKELFYRALDGMLTAVPVRPARNTLELGKPGALFHVTEAQADVFYPYDVAPDGQRFLVMVAEANAATSSMTVIVNWPALLKKESAAP
jgi:Tol biopolymer transport system component/tRNA A-37 threonylcarbamoyl transferase component Bud32